MGATDTTVFRTADVGFNARVEPFMHRIEASKKGLGFFEFRRQKAKRAALAKFVNTALNSFGLAEANWQGNADHKPAANHRIARLGLLQELREYAEKLEGRDDRNDFPHLIQNRDRNSMYIPVGFDTPFAVPSEDGRERIPVGSSIRLLEELLRINEYLKIESTFRIQKMPPFIDATETDIAKFESSTDTSAGFWERFGFVSIRCLTEISVREKLPMMLV